MPYIGTRDAEKMGVRLRGVEPSGAGWNSNAERKSDAGRNLDLTPDLGTGRNLDVTPDLGAGLNVAGTRGLDAGRGVQGIQARWVSAGRTPVGVVGAGRKMAAHRAVEAVGFSRRRPAAAAGTSVA